MYNNLNKQQDNLLHQNMNKKTLTSKIRISNITTNDGHWTSTK
jgi:hypothetical protein